MHTHSFNFNDLIVLSQINNTILKMDDCLDDLKNFIEGKFEKVYVGDYERLKQIPKHSRYAMWCENVFSNGYNELLVGFEFSEEKENNVKLIIQLYVEEESNKLEDFKSKILEDKSFKYDESDWGFSVWLEKPLSDFLSMDAEIQFDAIKNWFKNGIEVIEKFKSYTPELEWR